jgi:hypothetical protein
MIEVTFDIDADLLIEPPPLPIFFIASPPGNTISFMVTPNHAAPDLIFTIDES